MRCKRYLTVSPALNMPLPRVYFLEQTFDKAAGNQLTAFGFIGDQKPSFVGFAGGDIIRFAATVIVVTGRGRLPVIKIVKHKAARVVLPWLQRRILQFKRQAVSGSYFTQVELAASSVAGSSNASPPILNHGASLSIH